jgi:hypothetical protein
LQAPSAGGSGSDGVSSGDGGSSDWGDTTSATQ